MINNYAKRRQTHPTGKKYPKVSVIIPVYNVKEYLEECLNSVINQTLKDIEILCVDDGSTDGSFDILLKYIKKDSRIKVLRQKNQGAGVARNQALKIANGDYLAFLDGDDFYNLDYIEKMYKKSDSTKADIAICSANRFNTCTCKFEEMPWALNIKYLPEDKFVFNYKDMPNYIFNFAQNWNWNKLYRRSFIKKNKIKFQPLYRTNDLLFTCMALVKADKIITVQEPLVNYRIGMKTNSQSTNHLHPYDFYKAFSELRKLLIKSGIYKECRQSYRNHALSGLVYNISSIKDDKIKKKVASYLYSYCLKNIDLTNVYDMEVYNSQQLKEFEQQKQKYKKKFLLFDVDNSSTHKIITLLGIKLKIKK